MTWSTEIEKDQITITNLVKIRPRILIFSGFTLFSGSVYQVTLTVDNFYKVEENGITYSLGASPAALNAFEYYYDSSTKILYLRTSDSTEPSNNNIIITYEQYFASKDVAFNSTPDDSSTPIVYWAAGVLDAPNMVSSMSDVIFGATPTQSTTLTIVDESGSIGVVGYNQSYNLSDIFVYQVINDLITSNVKLLYSGICKGLSLQQGIAQFTVFDKLAILDKNYATPYFSGTADPNFIGRPAPIIYGRVQGSRGVNTDYDSADGVGRNLSFTFANTGNYRGYFNGAGYHTTSASTGTNTTTKTYIGNGSGLNVLPFPEAGDRVHMQEPAAPAAAVRNEYVEVLTSSYVGDPNTWYITHASIGTPLSQTDGSVYIPYERRVTVLKNGVKYQAYPGRDFTSSTGNITFKAGHAATMGMPSDISHNDTVYSDMIGLDAVNAIFPYDDRIPPFGSVNPVSGCLEHPAHVVWHILRSAGVTNAEIDYAGTFTTVYNNLTSKCAFSVPGRLTDEFPTCLEALSVVLRSCMLRLFLDSNNKFALKEIAPMTGTSAILTKDDILSPPGVNFEISYDDIYSDAVVNYDFREVSDNVDQFDGLPKQVTATYSAATALHKVSRVLTVDSCFGSSADAQELANRLTYIFGDRRLLTRLSLFIKHFTKKIGDRITLSRDRVPGFTYSPGQARSLDMVIVEVIKNKNTIDLTLDDQKGVEDNTGNW